MTQLSLELLGERFSELKPPMTAREARVEANRCLYCFDAPCNQGVPDQYRRTDLYPQNFNGQRNRRGGDDFGGQPDGRNLRARVPGRGAV